MNIPFRKSDTSNSLTAKKDRLAEIAATKAELDREAKAIEAELVTRYDQLISNAYQAKGEPFGTVNFDVDGEMLSINTPKKVAWDQPKLMVLYEDIKANGSNPSEYMEVEFIVPESKYKAWPEAIRSQFEPARTVAPGRLKIGFKGDANAS